MQAPTATGLHNLPVQRAMDGAWVDPLPDKPLNRHEEGGSNRDLSAYHICLTLEADGRFVDYELK